VDDQGSMFTPVMEEPEEGALNRSDLRVEGRLPSAQGLVLLGYGLAGTRKHDNHNPIPNRIPLIPTSIF